LIFLVEKINHSYVIKYLSFFTGLYNKTIMDFSCCNNWPNKPILTSDLQRLILAYLVFHIYHLKSL